MIMKLYSIIIKKDHYKCMYLYRSNIHDVFQRFMGDLRNSLFIYRLYESGEQ